MNRKYLPLIVMLSAGAITCLISIIRGHELLYQLIVLFAVLVVFYFLGSALNWTIDYFEAQNKKKAAEEGEVIEKDAEDIPEDLL